MSLDDSEKTEQTNDDGKVYALIEYSQQLEMVCNRIVNIGKIVFVGFPVFLMILQNLAGLDKIKVLLIWIIGMFALALVLILVGFFDYALKERLANVYGDEYKNTSKLKVLQGRALIKTIIEERNKDREERSLDSFTEEFSKNATEDEDTLLDRLLNEISDFEDTEDEIEEENEEKDRQLINKIKSIKAQLIELRARRKSNENTSVKTEIDEQNTDDNGNRLEDLNKIFAQFIADNQITEKIDRIKKEKSAEKNQDKSVSNDAAKVKPNKVLHDSDNSNGEKNHGIKLNFSSGSKHEKADDVQTYAQNKVKEKHTDIGDGLEDINKIFEQFVNDSSEAVKSADKGTTEFNFKIDEEKKSDNDDSVQEINRILEEFNEK